MDKARSLFIVSHGFETSQTATIGCLYVMRGLSPQGAMGLDSMCHARGVLSALRFVHRTYCLF